MNIQEIIDEIIFERTHEWIECPHCYGQGSLRMPGFMIAYCTKCNHTGYILISKKEMIK